MKKYINLVVLSIILWGCSKDSFKPNGAPNPKYNIPIQTTVNGLKDIEMKQNAILELPISIIFDSGTKEEVSLAITNLPDSVFVNITPQIDTPSFNSKLRFVSMDADTGTRTITLTTAASKATSTKTYTFQLTIKPDSMNYALGLVGSYTATGACTATGTINNTVLITATPGYYNRIKVEKIWTGTSSSYYFYADLNPANNTLTIPPQTNNGFFYSGNGTYNVNQLSITYSLHDGNLVSDNCTTLLSK